jgi:hypothetical protein
MRLSRSNAAQVCDLPSPPEACRLRKRTTIMRLLLLAFPLLVVSSRPADACSAPQCWPGAFVPQDGAVIPENAPGFYFRPPLQGGSAGDASLVRLTAASDPSTPLAFTAMPQPNGDFVLVPDAPLVAGETYTLEDGAECNGGTMYSTFTAGPSAPLPSSLGSVNLIGHGMFAEIPVATASGSCSTTVEATIAQITLDVSASAEPWKDLLLYETLVDDKPWVNQVSINVRTDPGESWLGRGTDLLYRVCKPNPDAIFQGLAEGGHNVRFRASLPGVTNQTSLATPAAPIEIMCTSNPNPDPEEIDNDGGGCATNRPATLGFVLLALLALVQRTRR